MLSEKILTMKISRFTVFGGHGILFGDGGGGEGGDTQRRNFV